MAAAAHGGMVCRPGLRGTSQLLAAVGLSPAGTRRVSVYTGTIMETPTMRTMAIGTPKSPSARRTCKRLESRDQFAVVSEKVCCFGGIFLYNCQLRKSKII